MPLYEYRCDACGRRFEKIQKFSDAPLETCELCGKGPVQKMLSSPAIQFKGKGWYITDYARKDSSASPDGPSPDAAGKRDKPEAKTESKSDKPAKTDSSAGAASKDS